VKSAALKMGNLQRDSLFLTAAGMTAAFGVGDGTRCRAASCHSICKVTSRSWLGLLDLLDLCLARAS
jgi:hypothetical protein